MRHGRQIFRQLLGWAAAALAAALLVNLALCFLHRPPAWLDRHSAATNAVLRPYGTYLMGTEGRGRHRVDSRGYLNPDLPLADSPVIIVGSSFVQGKEVSAGKRFADLMNAALVPGGDRLKVYTVSQDGFYLPQIARCFPALVAEFPSAETIIIETNLTDFSARELTDALEQPTPDPQQQGAQLWAGYSPLRRTAMRVKETLPILTLGKLQLTAMLGSSAGTAEEEIPASQAHYDAVAALLRSQFDGRLILLYHPDVSIEHDGSLSVTAKEQEALLREACQRNGITFLDAGDAWLQAYADSSTVPYGFSNTAMGSGHLNESGHRVLAELLLEALKGGDGA